MNIGQGDLFHRIYPHREDERIICFGSFGISLWMIRYDGTTWRRSIIRIGVLAAANGVEGILDDTTHATFKAALVAVRVWRLANLAEP